MCFEGASGIEPGAASFLRTGLAKKGMYACLIWHDHNCRVSQALRNASSPYWSAGVLSQ
jgi:hypothetical protein